MKNLLLSLTLSTLIGACGSGTSTSNVSASATTSPKEIALRSTEGTNILLTYDTAEVTTPSERITNATDVTINVSNDTWSGAPAGRLVRAVLLDLCHSSGNGAEFEILNRQIDLPYTHLSSGSGFGYEVQLNTLGDAENHMEIGRITIAGARTCRQELALVIDGVWATDPINGSHNFKFQMSK